MINIDLYKFLYGLAHYMLLYILFLVIPLTSGLAGASDPDFVGQE